MMSQYVYKSLGDEQDLRESWARSGSISFGEDYDKILTYLDRLDRPKWCRVLVDEKNNLVGTLMRSSLGMFIVGWRVNAESVGFVTIPPHHRGKRAGVEIMPPSSLSSSRGRGCHLSALFSKSEAVSRGWI
jgi:hypothetical protein